MDNVGYLNSRHIGFDYLRIALVYVLLSGIIAYIIGKIPGVKIAVGKPYSGRVKNAYIVLAGALLLFIVVINIVK